MDTLKQVRRMLDSELDNISKQNKVTQGFLDTVDKLTHAMKSIDTIIAMKESEGGSYRSYGRGGSYDYEGSYARDRRGRNADGSYRTRIDGGRDQRYSYDGYSRDIKEGLEHLMDKADARERMIIEKAMREIDD